MPSNNPAYASRLRRAAVADGLFAAVGWVFGTIGLLLPLGIIGFITIGGASVISWEFLTEGPGGFPLGKTGGILPAIQGSLALVAIGLVIALPLGVGCALYLDQYNRFPALQKTIRFSIECMAGIPSIVYGLFGYAFLVVAVGLNISLLAGGITLGIVMFPIIMIGSEAALRSVQPAFRESALALGTSRSYVIRRILLIRATPGILAVTVLATGHAFGTAAPILYTAATIVAPGAPSLLSPVMTLPTHLYYLVGQGLSFEHAYGTAIVLVMSLLLANALALYLKHLARVQGT